MAPADDGSTFLKIMARFFGYAANQLLRAWLKKGGKLIGDPVGFVVLAREGPLREGELERSVKWAESLLRK